MRILVRFYDAGALLCFLGMMGCVLLEVAARNVFQYPTTWAEEASRFFCVWTVFLGSASAWFRGSHILINIVPRHLSGKPYYSLKLLIDVLCALFLLAVWFGTLSIMIVSYPSKTTALEISISYFYLGLFLGCTGMLIFHFQQLSGTLRNLFE